MRNSGGERDSSIEAVINWLLENPESVTAELASTTEASASASESAGAAELTNLSTYLTPSDFASSDDYASYVRDRIAIGMVVRCCRGYDEVNEGDMGPVVQLDRDGLHDLNVQVTIKGNQCLLEWIQFFKIFQNCKEFLSRFFTI